MQQSAVIKSLRFRFAGMIFSSTSWRPSLALTASLRRSTWSSAALVTGLAPGGAAAARRVARVGARARLSRLRKHRSACFSRYESLEC